MCLLTAPSQGSQTSVNNLASVKNKGGFELHRMAEHPGPSSSAWNPRADKQIKCGTAGKNRRESFKQISAHVEAWGLPNIFMSWTAKLQTQTLSGGIASPACDSLLFLKINGQTCNCNYFNCDKSSTFNWTKPNQLYTFLNFAWGLIKLPKWTLAQPQTPL